MVDEVKDSLAEPAPVTEAPVALPEIPAVEAEAPVASAPAPAIKAVPATKRKGNGRKASAKPAAKPAPVEASATVAETKVAKPAKAKPVRAIPAKPSKAGAAKQPVAAAAKPAVKPANKRPFTATPRVKTIGAGKTAPRKELFAMATTTTEFTDKIQNAFKDAQEKAKAALEKSQAAFGDAGTFAKGNVEAVVESSKILASGLREMTKGYVEETKSAFETMTADVKDLASVKSPTEFFEKQSALLRKNFDAAVAATSKNSEAMLKLANEAFQPISTRVSLAVEKIKHAA